MAGRLLASLLRTCDTAACDQCWVALVRAAGSSTFTPAAAVTTAAGPWAPPLAGHTRSITTTAAGQAGAAATQPPTAAQPEQPSASEVPASSSAGASNQQQQQRRPAAKQQQAPKVPFEQLQEQYQEQLSLRNVRDEANMMLLVSSARGPEQVQAAMDLLRWDKMVRARQQRRYAPFSPHATRALLRAGRVAGMGTAFAVRLLQEADELGMQVSQAACEDVVGYCIDKKDYWAAAEAWVYTRVYCADPSRRQPSEAAADAAGQAADSQQQQQPQREGPLGWAGSRLVRTYAVGLAAWLQQGCVSTGHEHYVRQQLQQLVGELEGRGLSVPAKVKAALANDAAPAAAAAPEAPAAAAATSEPEAEAAAGPAAAAESEGSKETAT